MMISILFTAIALVLPKEGERSVVTIDPDGSNRVEVAVSMPIRDIQQVWTPAMEQPFLGRKWKLTLDASPLCNFPYLAFFNLAEQNRFALGAEALEWDCRVESRVNQELGIYEVKLIVCAEKSEALHPFKVTLDRRDVTWVQALADWREGLSYPKGNYPEDSWKPVFCTWYAVHAAVTQDWVERTARIAADLGFGTFILDDGWSYDEAKRVSPRTLSTWYRDVGTWNAFSNSKFPDFQSHRTRIREMGLRYLVWVAPYFVGARSKAWTRWGYDKRPGTRTVEGNALTDIRNAEQMAAVTDQLVQLLRETDLDGLKIDFLDSIWTTVDNPRGESKLAYVRDLMRSLRTVKPNGLFEYRQDYATPLTAALGTQFRAGDVPFEWLSNLMRLAQIRIGMGDGVPIHADPIYWSESETKDNVARHFMAAMAGVPMLSMDLEKLSPECREQIHYWLNVYVRHVERHQRRGHWKVAYRQGSLATLTSVLNDEALVIVNDSAGFPKACVEAGNRRLIVFNLSYEALKLPDGTICGAAKAFISN